MNIHARAFWLLMGSHCQMRYDILLAFINPLEAKAPATSDYRKDCHRPPRQATGGASKIDVLPIHVVTLYKLDRLVRLLNTSLLVRRIFLTSSVMAWLRGRRW